MAQNLIDLVLIGFEWTNESEGSDVEIPIVDSPQLGPGRQLVVVRPTIRLEDAPDRIVVRLDPRFVGAFPVHAAPRLTLVVTCEHIDGEDIVLVGLPTNQPRYWKLNLNGRIVKDSSWIRVRTGDTVRVLTRRDTTQGMTALLGLKVRSAGGSSPLSDDVPTSGERRVAAMDRLTDRFRANVFPADPTDWDRNSVILAAFCSAPSEPLPTASRVLAVYRMTTDNLSHSARYLNFLRRMLKDAIDPHSDDPTTTLEDILRVDIFPTERAELRKILVDRLRSRGVFTMPTKNVVSRLLKESL